MQIHEITLHDNKPLKEGLLDQWSARFGAASKDPAMAAMTPAQRVKAIQNDTALDKVSKEAWDNWVAKWYQIGAAKKGQVDQALLQTELRNYVMTNLLPRYQDFNSLSTSKDIDQNIRAVASTYLTGKPEESKKYFDRIVDLSAIASTVAPQPGSAQQGAQRPSAAPSSASAAQADVSKIMDQLGIKKTGQAQAVRDALMKLNANQPLAAASTRNPIADALLTHFGFRV